MEDLLIINTQLTLKIKWYVVGISVFRVHKMIKSILSDVSAQIGALISDIY